MTSSSFSYFQNFRHFAFNVIKNFLTPTRNQNRRFLWNNFAVKWQRNFLLSVVVDLNPRGEFEQSHVVVESVHAEVRMVPYVRNVVHIAALEVSGGSDAN